MLSSDRATLDYAQLVKRARQLSSRGNRLRVALLADVSTPHLAQVLRVLFHDAGFDAEIHAAGFDTVATEAYHSDSELYRFRPDAIVILQSPFRIRESYFATADRGAFVDGTAAALEGIWQAIRERSPALIIQGNFVLPPERPYGHYGARAPDTPLGAVTELNRELVLRSRAAASIVILDVDFLAGWIGRSRFLDEKMWALAKTPCALEWLPELAQGIVDLALAARGRAVKCVALDLDGTLWGGVVGDDGVEGIGLGELDDGGAFRLFQLYLRELARRGILLAVCSKNDETLARRVFRDHPDMVLRESDIAIFVANWNDKASNLRAIRDELNIGFDAMAFLDDNPFERNLVRGLIPDLIVPELPADPALYVRFLSELNLFEASGSSELDSRRAQLHREQQARTATRATFANLDEYLRSLDTTARVTGFGPAELPRVAQLIQRSNQFNLTTRRYTEAECAALAGDEANIIPLAISVQDRHGDFGLICVAILRRQRADLEIDTFVMSCRVLQRGVEQFAMNHIFELARSHGHSRVVGRFQPTAKNSLVRDFYPSFGFACVATEEDGASTWSLAVADYAPRAIFIHELS